MVDGLRDIVRPVARQSPTITARYSRRGPPVEVSYRTAPCMPLDGIGFDCRGETGAWVGESVSGKSVTAYATWASSILPARITSGAGSCSAVLDLLSGGERRWPRSRRELAIIFPNRVPH